MMSLENELIEIRRYLHKHPELSFEEYNTQKYIVNFFSEMNCVMHTIKTGVLAYFNNDKKDTIAFRCELDALNIKERTNAQYQSENDYMHACGHDGHMAICLKLGEYINNNLELVFRNVSAKMFTISSANTKAIFTDLVIVSSQDSKDWNTIINRSEISVLENDTSTKKEMLVM